MELEGWNASSCRDRERLTLPLALNLQQPRPMPVRVVVYLCAVWRGVCGAVVWMRVRGREELSALSGSARCMRTLAHARTRTRARRHAAVGLAPCVQRSTRMHAHPVPHVGHGAPQWLPPGSTMAQHHGDGRTTGNGTLPVRHRSLPGCQGLAPARASRCRGARRRRAQSEHRAFAGGRP